MNTSGTKASILKYPKVEWLARGWAHLFLPVLCIYQEGVFVCAVTSAGFVKPVHSRAANLCKITTIQSILYINRSPLLNNPFLSLYRCIITFFFKIVMIRNILMKLQNVSFSYYGNEDNMHLLLIMLDNS